MKAINNKLPFRKVLTCSLIAAQLLGAQMVSSNAYAGRFTPQAATGGTSQPAEADEAPPKPADKPAPAAKPAVKPVVAAAETSAEPQTVIGVPIESAPRFEVTDGDEKYTAEAKVIETSLTNPQYGYKDGQYVLIQNPAVKKFSAEITLYDSEGNFICASGGDCGLSAPDVTNQLHNLNAAVESTLKKDLAAITKKRKDEKKKKEKEDKLLASCKAVRTVDDDGEEKITKITSANRMEHFEEVLDCQIARHTEDKNPDKNDEDLTVKELRSKEIGGLLRRAMSDEDPELREMAQEAIENLEDSFGDTSNAVRSYLKVLGDGAENFDRLRNGYTMQDLNDSVGAWDPRNYAGKSEAFRAAVSDVSKMITAFGCENSAQYRNVSSGTMGTGGFPGGSQTSRCNDSNSDLDKAIGDGYSDIGNIGSRDGDEVGSSGLKRGIRTSGNSSLDNSGNFNNGGRLQRTNSPNSGAIFNQNQRSPFQPTLANPNQYAPNQQFPNQNRGTRFN